ncbi:MAG: pantetheine-phosphate adenylyltransferase [Candidatus Woesearchaeota archaeon]|nr:pantetheine-phosphate adenylyltransferase [Candidatus Woesearchaeota archaeon]
MMKKAIYAFSADPIHYGHIDIIRRSANVFDELVVGIGVNANKQTLFSLEERMDMVRKSLEKIKNVSVVAFPGLLVDYAYENSIPVIVKGVRTALDFDYEKLQHQCGESQKLGIDTFIMFARPELNHISSTSVKAMQKEQGLVHEFVPLYVKQWLEAKMLGQYIVGITGEPSSGKSYIGRKFEELGKERGISVHNIELDDIGHQILGELKESVYEEIRENIAKTFGNSVRLPDGAIDRKILGELVFNDTEQLKKLNEIMYTPILVRLRRGLYGKRGLILLNAALIAESEMAYLCNNNVVFLNVDKATQNKRLRSKDLTAEQIKRRLASQHTFDQKRNKLQEKINEENQGKIWVINNSDNSDAKEINQVFESIINELNVK